MAGEYLKVDSPEALLKASETPLLIEFSSFDCPPCLLMEPELCAYAKDCAPVRVVTVNVDSCPAAAAHFGVRVTPALAVLYRKKVLAMRYGAMRQSEIAEFVRAALEN